ncbi:2-oxoglutarate (2OG) and Fe(II)-dependent oxygenase superfamily protein [Artemisia annua]|uniref:2-oxoglutarate (2OG) and Fe(II)-dependent oxygenase superfamily protein n=1 Tax=Artemisia annua TaxID=35608 RepID=A0A2U1MXX2_ARTAN|nr:2-oxoglutarate (2OG) and Fe(II)-dependent oxygenase superfamily protein [Artemisia annua]
MLTSKTSLQLPIFDVSKPLSPSCLSSLSLACKEWGFFHIINHGISKELYNKLHFLSNQLFDLPYEQKLKVGPSSDIKTYTPHFIASPFFESIRVSGPDFCASAQSSAEVLLNQSKTEFSEVLKEYGSIMRTLSNKIIEMLLMCLGEDFEKKFESEFRNSEGYLRINNYSPPESIEKDVEGLGMHTDMSCITIVYQDKSGGLQVRSKEGKWMDIDPCAETLVVNIGDLMQAWSNGKLRSSEHRVVLKERKNRFSLAFFWCFEDNKVVFAPDEVVGENSMRAYKPFLCDDYMKFRQNSERGKFEKVGFTVKDFAGTGLV